jgi:hypothetical protein
MQGNPDIRRRDDNSIDFDFYRQRATQLRRHAKRTACRNWCLLCTKAVSACAAAVMNSFQAGTHRLTQ